MDLVIPKSEVMVILTCTVTFTRMVHRDIKPANILINRHGDFKVAC